MSDMDMDIPQASLPHSDFPSTPCSPGLQSPAASDGSCSDHSSASDGEHSSRADDHGQPGSPSTPSLSPHDAAFSSGNQFLNFSYKNLGVLAETNLEALRAEFGRQSPSPDDTPLLNKDRPLGMED